MRYRLFLYKLNGAFNEDDYVVVRTNKCLRDNCFKDEYTEPFDGAKVKETILQNAVGENGAPLCHAEVKYTPQKQCEYIYLSTSNAVAKKVLVAAYSAALEFGLVVYDVERKRTFLGALFSNDAFAVMRLRAQKLNAKIRETQQPIWKKRMLEEVYDKECSRCSYLITLSKNEKSFEERTKSFYSLLRESLEEGERLYTRKRCFIIGSERYEIKFCLEGYKKNPNRIGFVKYGKPYTDLIGRMGGEAAFKWVEKNNKTKVIAERMQINELVSAYPNPSDRFVACVNIEKQLAKEKFDIRYGSTTERGSEIIFHAENVYDHGTGKISVLKIEEESATFILPIICDLYPYFGERYYLEENHIPSEMMADIIKRMEQIKKLILEDTYNEKLQPYIKCFNLFILEDTDTMEAFEYVKNNETDVVHKHRGEIANFYDLFIRWAEAQMEFYANDDLMFNIEGP
ncbi:MAG: hypothetical protein IJF27_06795 [Oscillospiraceae bacterium]|nr:hypothetical protein [Oscillospiraceae bacterium]MBQ9938603.1 hypothetical protein [Oscillospiraceae bacterium]